MPHYRSNLLRAAYSVSCAAMILFLGCTRQPSVTIILDASGSANGREIVFVPLDPAPLLHRETTGNISEGQADSLTALRILSDSAIYLDLQFQGARTELNAETAAMDTADRRTQQYARGYEMFLARARGAGVLRARRDSATRAADILRDRLTHILADSTRMAEELAAARVRVMSASVGSRSVVVVTADSDHVTVPLAPGEWWVGVTSVRGMPARFTRIAVTSTSADTIWLEVPGDSAMR